MLSALRLRPKKLASKDSGLLPAPATFKRMHPRTNRMGIIIVIALIFWFLSPQRLVYFFSRSPIPHYPIPHPFTSPNVIESTSKFIFPPVEQAPKLKELTVKRLVRETREKDKQMPELEKSVFDSLNVLDDPNPAVQRLKEEAENALSDDAKIINKFKNQDKVVYKPKKGTKYPKVIMVTAVDFEKYSVEALAKIVQNRVDYAHLHNYGVYVRWYQEFVPVMNSLNFLLDQERRKWVRLFCLRAAMFAFPEAEWFWYLDEDALVMNEKVELVDYLLTPEQLKKAMLKEQPVIPPNGLIRTYKNIQPENVRMIFTQSDTKLETNSFIVQNDFVGRALLDMWTDRLFLGYNNFPFGPDSALTHILQWHPFVLNKSTIIPARTIASLHSEKALSEGSKDSDKTHYYAGDLVAQWGYCDTPLRCEEILNGYITLKKKQA